mmetsp:Transcript_88466/g.255165  ORF Transcript_88466/g.255165 Transcript_88466/m.255165 type:complete len:225 (-) Transcript_88466:620-1294(-)
MSCAVMDSGHTWPVVLLMHMAWAVSQLMSAGIARQAIQQNISPAAQAPAVSISRRRSVVVERQPSNGVSCAGAVVSLTTARCARRHHSPKVAPPAATAQSSGGSTMAPKTKRSKPLAPCKLTECGAARSPRWGSHSSLPCPTMKRSPLPPTLPSAATAPRCSPDTASPPGSSISRPAASEADEGSPLAGARCQRTVKAWIMPASVCFDIDGASSTRAPPAGAGT